MKKNYMFKSTYNRLLKRLEVLRKKRIQLIGELEKAASFGDLRENAEFDSAMELQGQIKREVEVIQRKLSNVEFIDNLKIPPNKVALGTMVTLVDVTDRRKKLTICIVGCIDDECPEEAIKITCSSPVAKKILGKSVGELVSGIGGTEQITAEIVEIKKMIDTNYFFEHNLCESIQQSL